MNEGSSSELPLVREEGLTKDEEIVIVDIDDNVTGTATRQEMRRSNLIHRTTTVIVANERFDEIFIHKRTLIKDWCPGKFDVGFGGCVAAGESYFENARRELKEESGLEADTLHHIGKYYYGQIARTFQDVWVFCHKGSASELRPQPEEIEYIKKMSVEEVRKLITEDPEKFTPDAIESFKMFDQWLSKQTSLSEKTQLTA